MTEKAKEIAEKLNKVVVDKEELETIVKDYRGYAFDSLVYRFKDYQARAFDAEVHDYAYEHNLPHAEARVNVKKRHNRDLMKFIQILDGLIGEHN